MANTQRSRTLLQAGQGQACASASHTLQRLETQPSAEDAENQDPSELLGRQREAATPANRMAVPQQLT